MLWQSRETPRSVETYNFDAVSAGGSHDGFRTISEQTSQTPTAAALPKLHTFVCIFGIYSHFLPKALNRMSAMSQVIQIRSPSQLTTQLSSSRIVVVNCRKPPRFSPLCPSIIQTDFLPSTVYAEDNGPSQAVAPVYAQLAAQLSKSKIITFANVNTSQQAQIASQYGVTS